MRVSTSRPRNPSNLMLRDPKHLEAERLSFGGGGDGRSIDEIIIQHLETRDPQTHEKRLRVRSDRLAREWVFG